MSLLSNEVEKRKCENSASHEFSSERNEKCMFVLGQNGNPLCLVCGFSEKIQFGTSHEHSLRPQFSISRWIRYKIEFHNKKQSSLSSQESFLTETKN